jgi:hypothetical protein
MNKVNVGTQGNASLPGNGQSNLLHDEVAQRKREVGPQLLPGEEDLVVEWDMAKAENCLTGLGAPQLGQTKFSFCASMRCNTSKRSSQSVHLYS